MATELKSGKTRTVRNLLLLFFALTISEGIIRKWIAPQLSNYIYFIKDPVALLILYNAISAKIFKRWLSFHYFAIISTLLILSAASFSLYNPDLFFVYFYGVRNYVLYPALIFIIPAALTRDDVSFYLRIIILLIFPASLLSTSQYLSPPSSFINKGVSDEDFIFMVAEGIVRPYGFFTFTYGHVIFVAACLCAWLCVAFDKSMKAAVIGDRKWLYSSIPLLLVMLFTTGSRSIYAYIAAMMLYSLIAAISSKSKSSLSGLSILFIVSAISFSIFINTPAYDVMTERNRSAIQSEGSPIDRAFRSIFEFTEHYETAPFWGHGIGTGTNAAAALARGGREQGQGFLLAEDEWSRIVLELGIPLGLLFILLRISLVFSMLIRGIKFSLREKSPSGLILAGFISPIIFNGSMTMQGSALALGVFFCGLSFSSNLASAEDNQNI